MCGITCIVRWSESCEDRRWIHAMTDTIRHRGPDDYGFLFTDGGSASASPKEQIIETPYHVYWGHRRLSILDLSAAGRQPMASRTSACWIMHNGEVYNYLELRKELVKAGYRFVSGTDTEVMLAAYEAWGPSFIERCNGMFATAILDVKAGCIHVWRDRFGIKPLYYHRSAQRLLFASEVKALLAYPDVSRQIYPGAVYAYLGRQIVDHRSQTFFRDIHALPPGHRMTVALAKPDIEIHPYYDLRRRVSMRKYETDPAGAVCEALKKSIRYRVRSDVRVGSCLSGGLDSSSIICLMDHLLRTEATNMVSVGERISAFSSCHEDPRYDERDYMESVARHCRVQTHWIYTRSGQFADEIRDLIWHQDEPFSSPSIYAQYCLMRSARSAGVPVLLDGQGGDELFLGYRKFFFYYLWQLLRQGAWATMTSELIGALICGDEDLFNWQAAKRYLPGKLGRRQQGGFRALTDDFVKQQQNCDPLISGKGTLFDRQIMDLSLFSLPALLRYEDRNSMAFAIETRLPFLDYELIELVLSLPAETKIRRGQTKYILRTAMTPYLPKKIIQRRTKMGFVMPETAWLKGGLSPLMKESLKRSDSILTAICHRDKVYEAFKDFMSGRTSPISPREFFRFLCLDLWAQTFDVDF